MPTMKEIMEQLLADITSERDRVTKMEAEAKALREQRIPAAKARIHKAEKLLRQLEAVYEEPNGKVQVRDEQGRHICAKCGIAFDSYQDLAAHEKAEHPEPEKQPAPETPADLKCPECGFVAQNPAGLGSHRYSKHGVEGTSR